MKVPQNAKFSRSFFSAKINKDAKFQFSTFLPDKQIKSLLNFLFSTYEISKSVTTVHMIGSVHIIGTLELSKILAYNLVMYLCMYL